MWLEAGRGEKPDDLRDEVKWLRERVEQLLEMKRDGFTPMFPRPLDAVTVSEPLIPLPPAVEEAVAKMGGHDRSVVLDLHDFATAQLGAGMDAEDVADAIYQGADR